MDTKGVNCKLGVSVGIISRKWGEGKEEEKDVCFSAVSGQKHIAIVMSRPVTFIKFQGTSAEVW